MDISPAAIATMRKLIAKSQGSDIDWEKDFANLSKAHQAIAVIAEALGLAVSVNEYKGNTYVEASTIEAVVNDLEVKLAKKA